MRNYSVEVKMPKSQPVEREYPYWATNDAGDLFFVTSLNNGIAVAYWDKIRSISEHYLNPLPKNSQVVITIK